MTCFRNSIKDGFYINKQGKKKSTAKYQKSAMKATAKKKAKKAEQQADKPQGNPFSNEQLQVLSTAFNAQSQLALQSNVPTIQFPSQGNNAGSLQQTFSAMRGSAGPRQHHQSVFQRLGEDVKNVITEQAEILLQRQHDQ